MMPTPPLTSSQIATLLTAYREAPRRTTPFHSQALAQNAPRGTIRAQTAIGNLQNTPRGTFAAPDWPKIHEQLATYLELLLKWNGRTNLTAIRDPQEIVVRHFGESLFTGLALAQSGAIHPGSTLLDFGSGAGFPGIPIQLLHPELHVTLAESQGKKAAFLREAIRTLGVNTEVWDNRTENLPRTRSFDVVTLRAVDNMEAAVAEALRRTTSHLAILTTAAQAHRLHLPALHVVQTALPNFDDGVLLLTSAPVPRS